jgi:penicillin-insensitive murein endopeptidase
MSVGDISRKGGGTIGQHRSHQSGRDVDIGFYIVDGEGRSSLQNRFVRFDAEGRSSIVEGVRFDDARNWALIEALLTDPAARIQKVFVASWIRARLLRFAEHENVAVALRTKAADVMVQPRVGSPHDDHFHVRVECPQNQRGVCDDLPRARPEHLAARTGSDLHDTRTQRVRTGSRDIPSTADKAKPPTNASPVVRSEDDVDDADDL